MAVAVLALFATCMLVLGAWRRQVQLRRTGDSGNRRAWRPDGSPEWWALAGTDVGYLAVGVGSPLAYFTGLPLFDLMDRPVLRGVGVVLAVLGVVLALIGQLSLGTSWRIGIDKAERTALVTTGVFGIVRNPIFAAVIVTFLGLTLMLPTPIALTGILVTFTGIQVQVRVAEEPHLRRLHGAAYADYASRVGRFLPGLGRLETQRESRI
jgi:protein-S-isoprenylcysteine O-methyltransferase Ste14